MKYKELENSKKDKTKKIKKSEAFEKQNPLKLNRSNKQISKKLKSNSIIFPLQEKKDENEQQLVVENNQSSDENIQKTQCNQLIMNCLSQQTINKESSFNKNEIKLQSDEIKIPLSIQNSEFNKSMNYEKVSQLQNDTSSIQKKKSLVGRPQKQSLQSAGKQKNMKEFEIEEQYGSQYSSENYQLIISTFIIFGSDNKNKNLYIAKKYYLGEKNLNIEQMIENHLTLEQKRMWLSYYKIKRIINTKSKELMEVIWRIFEEFTQTAITQNYQKASKEKLVQKSSKIQKNSDYSLKQYQATHLQDIESVRKLFVSSNILNSILSESKYNFFTEQCFDPQLNDEQINMSSKEIHKLDCLSFQKIILSSSNLKKSDFIIILFSCAICDYFDILSPYYDTLCNLL